jgi:hypothetical protein
MKRLRIISVSGLAAAAVVGLPMLPAQAQTSVIPSGYLRSAQLPTQAPPESDPAMTMSAGPLALGVCRQARRGS